jgi:broad specificity phosphatase PhoE
MEKEQQIYIILDRHPESTGNETGDHRNDPKISITEHGKDQARAQAEFMVNELFPRLGIDKMPQIWASPYTRVQEGLNIKLARIAEINPTLIDKNQVIHTDDMLMERNFGSLAYAKHLLEDVFKDDPAAQNAIRSDLAMGKAVYEGTPHSAKPAHGESHREMGSYTRHFRETLQRDIDEGSRVHWVMSHGDVIKALVAKQLHQHEEPIPTPGNCDVILISGNKGNWSVQKVYDGEAMQSCFDSPKYQPRPKRIGDLPFARENDL